MVSSRSYDKKGIGFELGSRGKNPLKALLKRLCRFKIDKYCSSHWPVYRSMIDEDRLIVGKVGDCQVESVNSKIGQHLGRFRRKTICYSKSLESVKLALSFLFENDLIPT